MKFGLYSSIANPPRGEQLDRCIDEVIAEAQLAEASGFDSCFFGEHHQDHDGFLPSPLIVATAVAARTHTPARRHLGDPAAAPPSGARGRGRHHARSRVQGPSSSWAWASAISPPTSAPSPSRWRTAPARFEESIEILRRCWSGERVLVPRQALHARGRRDPAAPLPEVGAAAVDRRQHRRRRAPRRSDRRRLRRHAQHQHGERHAPGRRLQGGGPRGAAARPRSSRCATPGWPPSRAEADARLRPARDDRVSLLLGESPGRVPQPAPPARSSRWRISPPIA